MPTRVVIIGGGIAGTTLAEALATQKDMFQVSIIERETHPLYSRVLLPHYLRGQVPRERVFLKQENWYESKGIEWMRGVEALAIDEKNKFVTTSDGREIPYNVLVIAGGGDVRLRPEDLQGICYLRGIDDADILLSQVARVRAEDRGSKAVVLGSSFIAIEFINYFKGVAGFETHACLRGHGFWSSILDTSLQEHITQHLRSQGVVLHAQASTIEVEGGEVVERVRVGGEVIEDVGIIGAGIGIVPDIAALVDTSIERVGVGVQVNEYLETNIKDVYAIGDITHYYDIHAKRHVTMGNWQNAMSQGRHLAKTLQGEREPFDLVTSYATNVLGLEVTFIGDTVPKEVESMRVVKEGEAHIQLFERGGNLVGAVILGPVKARAALTQAIKEQKPYGTHT